MVIQLSLLTAVQLQLAPLVTLTVLLPPPGEKLSEVGESVVVGLVTLVVTVVELLLVSESMADESTEAVLLMEAPFSSEHFASA